MTTAEKPSQVLRRLGHKKEALQDNRTLAVCTAGAIYCSVLGTDELSRPMLPISVSVAQDIENKLMILMSHLGLHPTGDPLLAVGTWNDAPERTADECVAALEACGL